MRILIVSRTPWNVSNSFGNTFSNLFVGMDDVEIYHICCKHGATKGSPAKATFQMSDLSVMHSILRRRGGVGWSVDSQDNCADNAAVSKSAEKNRRPFALYVRDLIWTLGAWKNDAALRAFLDEAKPDVLYLPLYSSCYMCDVQQYVVDALSIPVVGHISDDLFAVSPESPLLMRHYAHKVAKKLRRLIDRCSYLEVFAENMQRQYAEMFHKPVYLIGKGVDIRILPKILPSDGCREKHFIYTGNIGGERWRALLLIGKALNGQAVLDIYSVTVLTEEMKTEFAQCDAIQFHGAVSADEVPEIQRNGDVLVHVEGFSPAAIAVTRMSFSTKLIDYMMAGKPIFAVGDLEINSIAVLKKYGLAVVAASVDEIGIRVNEFLSGCVNIEQLGDHVAEYLVNYRDIRKIQEGMTERLRGLVEYDQGSANQCGL